MRLYAVLTIPMQHYHLVWYVAVLLTFKKFCWPVYSWCTHKGLSHCGYQLNNNIRECDTHRKIIFIYVSFCVNIGINKVTHSARSLRIQKLFSLQYNKRIYQSKMLFILFYFYNKFAFWRLLNSFTIHYMDYIITLVSSEILTIFC